ncbi:MAG: four helix bundle protein [Desulfobacula sp.]|uniref:four helix bundle protein n=1 Tax=Desulfobacula sp. TaxID=2593537 RepID=UPI0025BA1408|nr:four helix bundle protein [Desulfobacula sp.]MCD4718778.1 four helix bundle protein [Desulfobacula sp.]
MARYEHLPIYKKAMEMAVYIQNMVRNFSRFNKYSVGMDLRDLSRKILLLIIRANSAREKQVHLQELVEYFDMLKTMLVFAKEVRAFNNFKSFQHASGMAVILCKKSEGWLKSSKNGRNYQPSMAGR